MTAKSLIDDMMTLGGGLLSGLGDVRKEVKAQLRARADGLLRDCELVTREEFDAAFAMLTKARQTQEDLATRLTRLEAAAGLTKSKPAGPAKPKAGPKRKRT